MLILIQIGEYTEEVLDFVQDQINKICTELLYSGNTDSGNYIWLFDIKNDQDIFNHSLIDFQSIRIMRCIDVINV